MTTPPTGLAPGSSGGQTDGGSDSGVEKGLTTGTAEAGIHAHGLERENEWTKIDGAHTHVFWIDGQLVQTEEDGAHKHDFSDEGENFQIWHGGEHFHKITLPDGTKLDTEHSSSGHGHEVQVETTAFDGIHVHSLKIPGGQIIDSLSPGDFWRGTGEQPQAGNPPLPPSSALIQAVSASKLLASLDTFKVKTGIYFADDKIYVDGLSKEVVKSIETAVGRMLPPEVADAIKVVEGRPSGDSVELADLVVRMRKQVSVTQVEQVDAGEREAFKSEGNIPGVLTWRSVESGHMPPDGISLLPESIEKVIPERFRYWKAEGDDARCIRDQLFDSGLITEDSILAVDGQPQLVITKRYMVDPSDIDHGIVPIKRGFDYEVSTLVEKPCVKWDAGIDSESISDVLKGCDVADPVVVFSPDVSGSARQISKKISSWDFDFFISVPDSIGARHCLSKVGSPFIVKRSSMAGLLCLSSVPVAKANVEFVGDGVAELGDHPFSLRKQSWDGHSLWHIDIGGEAWTLQGDPVGSESVIALKSETKKDLDGDVAVVDTGRASFIDRDVDSISIKFDGREMLGVRKLSRLGGSSVWSLEPGYIETVSKSYEVRVVKGADDDERFILGVVLEPDSVDSQDDTLSPGEIRQAAHKFMQDSQTIGIQHEQLAKDVRILESYIAPVDFAMGDQQISKGTWLLAVKVLSDALWKAVKDGDFTGFSIGGTAVRTPA